MNQVVIDKMQRKVMVVKNDVLFATNKRRNGLLPASENYEELILNNYEYMVRGEAEVNPLYKQPITYGVLVSTDKKVFVYKRGGSNSNAGESRLHSKISLGVGGHIEVADKVNKNLLKDTLFREIEEELNIKSEDIKEVQALGYINDDSNEVGKFHIGVCYALLTNNTNTTLTDGELDKGEFLSIEEIKEIFENPIYDVENRSRIILDDVERYVKTI